MDRLSEIPPNLSTVKTPEEVQIMGQFFQSPSTPPVTQTPSTRPVSGSAGPYPVYERDLPSRENYRDNSVRPSKEEELDEKPSKTRSVNWKLLGVMCLAFILLANPWVDGMLSKFKYLEEKPTATFGVRLVLFAIIMLVASFFM